MSKRYRFAIVLVIMAICFVFLWPSLRWYFLIPRDQQAQALESREQIKTYASRTAQADLQRLITLAQEGADVPGTVRGLPEGQPGGAVREGQLVREAFGRLV